jgi:hypothetical protein
VGWGGWGGGFTPVVRRWPARRNKTKKTHHGEVAVKAVGRREAAPQAVLVLAQRQRPVAAACRLGGHVRVDAALPGRLLVDLADAAVVAVGWRLGGWRFRWRLGGGWGGGWVAVGGFEWQWFRWRLGGLRLNFGRAEALTQDMTPSASAKNRPLHSLALPERCLLDAVQI